MGAGEGAGDGAGGLGAGFGWGLGGGAGTGGGTGTGGGGGGASSTMRVSITTGASAGLGVCCSVGRPSSTTAWAASTAPVTGIRARDALLELPMGMRWSGVSVCGGCAPAQIAGQLVGGSLQRLVDGSTIFRVESRQRAQGHQPQHDMARGIKDWHAKSHDAG